jgi:rod shape-determining protein MreB
MVRGFKEQYGYVGDSKGRINVKVPVGGVLTPLDITDDIKSACESILPSIVETTIDLIARYEPDFQEQVKKNIFVAGGGSQIHGIAGVLEEMLKPYGLFKVRTTQDPLYAGAEGGLLLAQDMPAEYWESM